MIRTILSFCAAGVLLTGCAAGSGAPGTPTQGTATQGTSTQRTAVQGYFYHDGNHPDGFSPASPPQRYDTSHGTWLWPPAVSDKPN